MIAVTKHVITEKADHKQLCAVCRAVLIDDTESLGLHDRPGFLPGVVYEYEDGLGRTISVNRPGLEYDGTYDKNYKVTDCKFLKQQEP